MTEKGNEKEKERKRERKRKRERERERESTFADAFASGGFIHKENKNKPQKSQCTQNVPYCRRLEHKISVIFEKKRKERERERPGIV